MSAPRSGIELRWRSAAVMAVASVIGLIMLMWPLVLDIGGDERLDPPFFFMALLPLVIAVVLAEIAEGGIDSRTLALLGVLSAINAVLRAVSSGTAGVEFVFFLLVLAGRVFGPGFGFVLGCTSLLTSGLITAGVGPWLPFQMIVAAWVGMGAGLLPRRVRGGREIAMLTCYVIVACYVYGLLLNLQGWPFGLGLVLEDTQSQAYSFIPGAALSENLERFVRYTLLTSTTSWDTMRAIANGAATAVLGASVLASLRRTVPAAVIEADTDVRPLA